MTVPANRPVAEWVCCTECISGPSCQLIVPSQYSVFAKTSRRMFMRTACIQGKEQHRDPNSGRTERALSNPNHIISHPHIPCIPLPSFHQLLTSACWTRVNPSPSRSAKMSSQWNENASSPTSRTCFFRLSGLSDF